MDNHNFPPLEPENSLPEHLPEIPERMEPLKEEPPAEELPIIEELTFEPAVIPAAEPIPAEEPIAEEVPAFEENPISEEAPAFEEPRNTVEAAVFEEEPIAVEAPDFEESLLPEEPVLQDTPQVVLMDIPETHPEIQPDDQAMDFHGLLEHGEEAQPEEILPEEEPQNVEEPLDQEYRDSDPDFDLLMQQRSAPQEKNQAAAPASSFKGRPKRKKGEGLLGIPSILVTFVWLALIVIIGVTAGRMLWICAADVLAFGREDKVVTVTVYEADTMDDIIDKLQENGLIRYKSLFRLYADISDAEEDIKPGIYDLNTRYDYHALVNFMSPRSSREVIKLTIPEGYTCRQIFALLEENRICTALDAAAYAAKGELKPYWFLEGVERGTENCLEGYLFPDTYEFYKNSTPREALERMLNNFEYRFDGEMLTQLEALNGRLTDNYTVREIVIVASLIEKESAAPGESPMISGVIYNRLFRWGNNPPYLNIDASIVYAQEGNNARIDTSLDHPYNTYTNTGLTPGPIANPGLSSLKAALNPESHNYYYYVLNPSTGMHQFSTTYEEHQGYVQQFATVRPEVED